MARRVDDGDKPYGGALNWYVLLSDGRRTDGYGVKVQLNHAPTVEEVQAMNPAGVVVAAGAKPIIPRISGLELPNVTTSHEVISGRKQISGKAAVIGSGMTGLECAEKLCMDGVEVTVIEMADQAGPGMFSVLLADIMGRLKEHGTQVLTGHRLTAVNEKGAVATLTKTGEEKLIEADWVVLSLGVTPQSDLANAYREAFDHVIVLGDNAKSGRIAHAVKDGYIKACAFLAE